MPLRAEARPLLDQATATGDARVQTQAIAKAGGKEDGTEEIRGDTLVATMRERNGAAELSTVTGSGHTLVRRVAEGITETSRGAALDASFEPVAEGERGNAEQQQTRGWGAAAELGSAAGRSAV